MCCFTLSGICWYLIPDLRAPKFYGLFAYGKGTGDGNDLRCLVWDGTKCAKGAIFDVLWRDSYHSNCRYQ